MNTIKETIGEISLGSVSLSSVIPFLTTSNPVIVFDDCDSVLLDDLSLNILKAALDSKKVRRICWNTDSFKLRNEGVPDHFEFKGCLLYTSPSPRDGLLSRMPSSA